jgi:hypothetical protein
MMAYKLSLRMAVFVLGFAVLAGCRTDQATTLPELTPASAPALTHTPTISTSPQPEVVKPPAGLWGQAVPPEAFETYRTITSADIPPRDWIDLTRRLNDPGQPIPRVVRAEPWGFELGDAHEFWVEDRERGEHFQVAARLVYKTEHTYFFVEEDIPLNEAKLKRLGERFETQIYPANRAFFGWEWSPGVDNDPHLTILLVDSLAVYYQNSRDEYSRLVNPYSNEMEIIYLGVGVVEDEDDCVLAHEFQHVIQWAVDPGEETWLNEGFSELACALNGLKPWYSDLICETFAAQPDTQLNAWSGELNQAAAQMGASYLFMTYFMARFGEQTTRALAADQSSGVDSLDGVLRSLDSAIGFDDVFADWVVANYLDDPNLADGRYGYQDLDPPPVEVEAGFEARDLPVERRTSVGQYSADYIVLHGGGSFQVDFAGASLVGLAPASAHSGRYVWWGGRGTNSDSTLTREFDLSGLRQATLIFHTWYDIDKDFDYAYVEVSLDGEHWLTLPGRTTSDDDPNALNYGNGFTGYSDGWIREEVDLTPYSGQKVQIRFEYLTDDGPLSAGFFLDDIEIPELGYLEQAESDGGGWVAQGFTRNTMTIPQQWLVQLITQRQKQTTVERLQLAEDHTGSWTVNLGPEETAVLAVSGITRETTEPAEYWYRVVRIDE